MGGRGDDATEDEVSKNDPGEHLGVNGEIPKYDKSKSYSHSESRGSGLMSDGGTVGSLDLVATLGFHCFPLWF